MSNMMKKGPKSKVSHRKRTSAKSQTKKILSPADLGYKSLEDKLKELPPEEQAAIQARTEELIAEEMTLRDLRKALKLTQEEIAEKLHIKQESVSKLEQRSDLLLSTLGAYIESMGGTLTLTASFPNRPPVNLTGFEDIDQKIQ